MNEAEVNAWNEFAKELRKRVRWDLEKIGKALLSALQILPALTADERAALLKIGLKVAERSSKFAVTFLRLAPGVLASIDPSCRHTILRWAEILASESRESLLEFLDRSPQTIKALPEKERSIYLDLGLRLASEDWPISLKYFMNLSKISHEISSEKIYHWYKDGLPLIDKNLPAALAYYSLESRHSQERGQAQSTAIFFEEVARPLKLFAQALTGESLSLKPLPELREGMQNSFYFLP